MSNRLISDVEFLFERYKSNLEFYIAREYKERGHVGSLDSIIEVLSDIQITGMKLSSEVNHKLSNLFFNHMNDILENYNLDSLVVLYEV